jgi:hypothetical protein
MQLIAHATEHELAISILMFLAGVCVGPWLAHIIVCRPKARRD